MDTNVIPSVEPSSFAAAGDSLLVHHDISFSTACLGDHQWKLEHSIVLVEILNDW